MSITLIFWLGTTLDEALWHHLFLFSKGTFGPKIDIERECSFGVHRYKYDAKEILVRVKGALKLDIVVSHFFNSDHNF